MNTIIEIPLEQLHESPFNPRKVFTGIDELAATILAEGRIHQPLLVRPRFPNPLRDDITDGYEIVFGHRRYRAAERACLTHAPCMVRAMSAAEARSAQTVENLQRVDIHPIEEAEGYRALMEHDQLSADDLAVKFGKSRSHVYGRLKLLQACPQVRESCLKGEVGAEVALLLARLRTDKLQAKALQYIKARNQDIADGGKDSFRRIRDILAENFNTALKSALFPTEDTALVPEAGACSACPKRAGNAPEFDDIADPATERQQTWKRSHFGADVCTDPDCWAAKKTAHLARQAAELARSGKEVIAGNKARAAVSAVGEVKGAYVAVADVRKALKSAKVTAPAEVLIQDPREGKVLHAYRREDLVQAGLPGFGQSAKAKEKAESSDARWKRQQAERKAKEQAAAAETRLRLATLVRVREVLATRARTVLELRLTAAAAIAGVDWESRPILMKLHGVKTDTALLNKLNDYTPHQLGLVLLDCALVKGVVASAHRETRPGNLLAIAEQCGVDVKAVRAEAANAAADTLTDDLPIDAAAEEQDEEAEA